MKTKVLFCKSAIGFRYAAAKILNAIGDPLGIVHLTYNSLGVHPILQEDHRQVPSGWTDTWLLRQPENLTEECVELLVQDMLGPTPCFHGDVLATLPAEKIVPRMLELLAFPGETARYAAYVLAIKGCEEGRKLLEYAAKESLHPVLAIIGLSHIPNTTTIDILKAYADPSHPYYASSFPGRNRLSLIAKQRLELVTAPGESPFLEVLKKYPN